MSLQFELYDQNQIPEAVKEFSGREIMSNILGWQGGARVGNGHARVCCLLSVVADKQGGCSLFPIGISK